MKARVLLTIGLLGALPAVAAATSLVRLSLEQLSQASTEIVRAHVVRQQSQWNSNHTWIVTLTTVALDQSVKGQPPATLVLEQPGGTVGNIHVYVPGTIRFFPQSHYLLFLERSGADPSRFLLVGMGQGAYRIYRDAMTKEERVILPFGGLFERRRESNLGMKPPSGTLSLSEFRRQLTAALETPLVVPRGTSIPLAIQTTEPRGVGRVRVSGQTTADLFPTSSLVIPAGSMVEGTAELVNGKWRIHWTEMSVRGARVAISAGSEEPTGTTLRGRVLLINVR